jgi:hypothetical protein
MESGGTSRTCSLFPDGDTRVLEEGGVFYLKGPTFDKFNEPQHVYDHALEVIDEMFPVVSFNWALDETQSAKQVQSSRAPAQGSCSAML